MESESKRGLCIELSRDYPTLIRVGDIVIEIYRPLRGGHRMLIVNPREVQVVGPHVVKRVGRENINWERLT